MRPPIYEPKGRAREYAPLALNLWDTCSHGCKYCYVPKLLHKKPEDFHVVGPPREGVLEALRKQLDRDVEKERPEFCGGDRRVLLSFISDAYQPHEDGTTREALEMLVEYDVPFSVLTKGGMRAVRDFDLYANGAGHFGTTLCFTDDLYRQAWEPNGASVYDREQAIVEARSRGIRTWISIEPVVMTGQALQVITWLSHWTRLYTIDEFRVGKLNYIGSVNTDDEETKAELRRIDWAAFALDALAALQESGCDWYIKDDLYAYLPPGSPQSYSTQSQHT